METRSIESCEAKLRQGGGRILVTHVIRSADHHHMEATTSLADSYQDPPIEKLDPIITWQCVFLGDGRNFRVAGNW